MAFCQEPQLKLLVTDNNFEDDAAVERRLAAAESVELVVEACRSEADVRSAIGEHDPDAVIVQFASIGRRALGAGTRLRAVVRCGVGLDNVDERAARDAGISVAGVPDYCVDEVADHTMALLLAVERRVVRLSRDVEEGGWSWRVAAPVRRLQGLTLGLVGLGRIGRAVERRALPFGLTVIAHDPQVHGASAQSLDDVLRRSDIVSLHVPLTDETRALISRRELGLMRPGGVLLNVSRGGLVDEDALLEALQNGRLRGAGLDVLAREPPHGAHPLRRWPTVVLTPHAAWYSAESIVELRTKAFETAIRMASA